MKNLITNGNFESGPINALTPGLSDANLFLAPGWLYTSITTTNPPIFSRSALAFADLSGDLTSAWAMGLAASSVLGGPGSNDKVKVTQRITNAFRRNTGRDLTLSFYVKGFAPGQMAVSVNGNFGTGGSPNATVNVLAQSFNFNTGYQRFAVTFRLPDTALSTFGTNLDDYLEINFWFHAGVGITAESVNTLAFDNVVSANLANVQLEQGSVVTRYEDNLERVDQLYVGLGKRLRRLLFLSTSLDFPSTAAGAVSDLTATVSGAQVGDIVLITAPTGADNGFYVRGFVSAENTVTVRAKNLTAGVLDPAAFTASILVLSF